MLWRPTWRTLACLLRTTSLHPSLWVRAASFPLSPNPRLSVCLSDGEAGKHSCMQPQPQEQHIFRTTNWFNELIYEMGQCQMCLAKFKCHDKRRLVGTNLSRNKGWSGRELSCLGFEVTKVTLCQITRETRNINHLIMQDCLLKIWNSFFFFPENWE